MKKILATVADSSTGETADIVLTAADSEFHYLKKPGCRVFHPSDDPTITITKTGEERS